MGHIIVDLNLKGLSYEVTGDIAMFDISEQLRQQLSLFDIASYSDIYECVRKQCFPEKFMGIVEVLTKLAGSIIQVFFTIFTIATLFGGLYTSQFIWDYIDNHHFVKHLVWLVIAVAVLILLCCV